VRGLLPEDAWWVIILRRDGVNFTFFTNTLNFTAEKIIRHRLMGCPVEGLAGWAEMFKFISGTVFIGLARRVSGPAV
jgi:hypothetical protein